MSSELDVIRAVEAAEARIMARFNALERRLVDVLERRIDKVMVPVPDGELHINQRAWGSATLFPPSNEEKQ